MRSLGQGWLASQCTRGFGGAPPITGGLSPKAKPDNFWTLECLWMHQITSILQKMYFEMLNFLLVLIVFLVMDRKQLKTVNTSIVAFSRWLTASCIVTYVPIFLHGTGI